MITYISEIKNLPPFDFLSKITAEDDILTLKTLVVTIFTTCFNNQLLCTLHLWVPYDYQNVVVISLNSINQLTFVSEKYCVFFEVYSEFLKYYLDKL
jgi:hypothetical protein